MTDLKKKITERDIPREFDESTIKTIERIEHNANVVGIMYLRKDHLQLCTVPEGVTQVLSKKLPILSSAFQMAIRNIILLVLIMKILSNLLKDSHDEWLVRTTAFINNINPIVDRIMDDDSVEGVIMTNEDGVPILTNINLNGASNYGIGMKRLGQMTQISTKEIDPFDDVLVLRLITRKIEIMVTPHSEFNIIVIQNARGIKKHTDFSKNKTVLTIL